MPEISRFSRFPSALKKSSFQKKILQSSLSQNVSSGVSKPNESDDDDETPDGFTPFLFADLIGHEQNKIGNRKKSKFTNKLSNNPSSSPRKKDEEPDGIICRKQRDPPGQKSNYIIPGDETKEVYRLGTYVNLMNISADPMSLANHGFLWTGYKDRVKCFSCGSSVQSWSITDDPASAEWHYEMCDLVLGKETRNQPILPRPIRFAGKVDITSSFSNSDSDDLPSSSSASYSQPKQLFQLSQTAPLPAVGADNILTTSADEVTVKVGNISIAGYAEKNFSAQSQEVSSLFQQSHQSAEPKSSSVQLDHPVENLMLGNITSKPHIELLKSLDLCKELDRRKSFEKRWGYNFQQVTPFILAQKGFFYLGDADRVQCFSCSIVIANWLSTDVVTTKHRQRSPNCWMVLEVEPRNIPITSSASLPTVAEPSDPTPKEVEELSRLFPCLHPHSVYMVGIEERMQTFDRRWPKDRIYASVPHIAKAGFFFLGDRDRAKCFYCNGGLQNWNPDDEPFTEHAKWFPGCEYVLRTKGIEFVKKVCLDNLNIRRPHLPHSRFDPATLQVIPVRNDPNKRGQTTIVNNNNGSVMTNGTSSNRTQQPSNPSISIDETMAQFARPMGFSDEQIKKATEKRLRDRGRNFEDFQEMLNALLDEEENQRQNAPSPVSIPSSSSSAVSNISETSLKRNKDESSRGDINNVDNEETPIKRSKSGLIENPQAALASLEYERNCKHCLKNIADSVVLPCGHLSLCDSCVESGMKKCPLCKRRVEQIIKAFLS